MDGALYKKTKIVLYQKLTERTRWELDKRIGVRRVLNRKRIFIVNGCMRAEGSDVKSQRRIHLSYNSQDKGWQPLIFLVHNV